MDAGKVYPIGIQTLENIRDLNAVYVDKTALMYKLTHSMNYVFLSRPRRFGKSLLCSVIKSYFEGKKELFSGLAVEKLEKSWTKYPVLSFSLGRCKNQPLHGMIEELGIQLSKYERLYGKDESETSPGKRLSGLVQRACEQTGQKAVIIIDEYDAPLLDVLHDDEKVMDVRQMLQEFYSSIKDNDPYQRFVFITGITKFSQLSIFSTINNLKNISMVDEYSAICGISRDEMHQYFDDDMPGLAKSLGCTSDEAMEKLKSMYDGYHFSDNSEDIYNPFSVLNALSDMKLGSYWFSSGTPSYLFRQLKRFNTDFTTLDGIETSSSSFDQPTEDMVDALPLLYQSGYLTIKSYDKDLDIYTLGIPNKEVRMGLMRNLLPVYTDLSDASTSPFAARFAVAVRDGDIDRALILLRSFFAGLSYPDGGSVVLKSMEKSEFYYNQMLYIVFSLFNSHVRTQVRTSIGRIDMVMETSSVIYVFEVKLNRPAVEALAQIDSNQYAVKYEADGRKIVKIGISFSTKTRTVEEWIVK